MFGKIVGAGQAGFVFENPKNPDSYFKIVALPEQPLEKMPLRSTKARLGAINQNQAELFFRLYQEDLDIPQLPKVFAFYTGTVTPKLRRNLLNAASEDEELESLVRGLKTNQKIAVWEMERIPCLSENDFCERYPTRQPHNNPDYQNLLDTMLDLGFVVRDVANPENFGYRENGTQVFYDPIVAPWPVQEVTKVSDPNRYARFVASFGPDQISTTRRAIQSGDYFGWYHSGGVMEAEMTNKEDAHTVEQYRDSTFILMARTSRGNDYNVSPLALYHAAWKAPNRRGYVRGVEELVEEIAFIFDNLGTAPNPYAIDIFLLVDGRLKLAGVIKYGKVEASYPYEDLAELLNRRLDFERSAETLQDNYFPEGTIYNPNQSGAINWIKPAPYLDIWASFYGDIVEWLQENVYEMDDDGDSAIEMWERFSPDLKPLMEYVQQNDLDSDDILPEIMEESPLNRPYSTVSKPQLIKSRNAGFLNFMRRATLSVPCAECYGKGYINRTAGEYDEHEWTEECETCNEEGEVDIDNTDNRYYRQHKEDYPL
jgi:hypothetical protein